MILLFCRVNNEQKHIIQNYFSRKPVIKAYLFGSAVKGKQTDRSDIDVLVELDYANGANYFLFYDMQQELSNLLKKKVDLISANGLSKFLQPILDKEKVLIYEA